MGKINFNTNNIIIMVFPRFSGGKFVSNCLSLSNHVLSQCNNKQFIHDLLRNNNSYELSDRIVLQSLPSKIVMRRWMEYEYGCFQFFNAEHGISYNENEYHDYITDVSNSNKKFFVMAHRTEILNNIRKRWPNAKEIHLENYHEHRMRSMELKYGSLKRFRRISTSAADIFIDISKIYDFPLWSKEIQRLYAFFEFNDFDQDRLHTFWKAYIDLHIYAEWIKVG